MKNIFIYYSDSDYGIYEKIYISLVEAGYKVVKLKQHTHSEDINIQIDTAEGLIDAVTKADLIMLLFSERFFSSDYCKSMAELVIDYAHYENKSIFPIALENYPVPKSYSERFLYLNVSKDEIEEGDFKKILYHLARQEALAYEAKKTTAAEKEIKQEVIKRISDSSQLKEVILDLKNKENINKRIAMGCYFAGIAGIIFGAVLAYLSVSNIPGDRKSYYYIYIGAKNLAIIGVLILCSRYTFNIGKIYMDEAVKHSDRLHAIHYGKFFLESFQEKLTFEEMKELFKDWNMDNKPTTPTTLDPTATDPNTASISGKSEAGIAVDLLTRLTDLLSSQKK
ncbi:toll/interleukin-1 receptor domain-containing protein [Priestia megaterium]|uniref:toll/interleukin-1 receptor domain-containing protein n=1 Tax=Priestia megaterium TaxID=1404 RepID=UPI003242C01D